MTQRKNAMQYIVISIAVLTVIVLLIPNVYVQLSCFIILYIVCLSSIDFDISHPFVWFIPLFTLYTIGYPLMYEQGYYATLPNCGDIEMNSYTVLAHWCALATFIITVSNKQVAYRKAYHYKVNSLVVKVITMGLVLSLFMQYIAVMQSGFHTKREILDGLSTSLFFRLGKMATQILPITTALLILDMSIKKREKIFWLLLINGLSFLQMVIIGERSAILQIVVVELLAYNIRIKKISLKKAFIFGGAILFFIIIAVGMKASLGKNWDFDLFLSKEPLWVKIFNAEFSCASINTANILNHQGIWEYEYGLKYLLLFFLPFTFQPLSGFMKILGFKNLFHIADNSAWYHDNILIGAKSGYGFSMVADGYMESGFLGVIVLYFLLGMIVKKAYRKSSSSILYLTFYIVMIPIFIYSTRATLLYFITYSVKYILLPLAILSLFKVRSRILPDIKNKK